MNKTIALRVLCLSFLWALAATAADIAGLRLLSEVKVDAQMAGAPFEGEPAASVWAISFSPDAKYLAFGVQFAKAKNPSHPSWLLVVSLGRPDAVLRKYEIPRNPDARKVSRLVWSADGRYLGVTPYSENFYQVAVVDLNTNQMSILSNSNGSESCNGVAGVLPGPEVLQSCYSSRTPKTVVRFIRLDGTAAREELTFPRAVRLLGVSPDGGKLALNILTGSGGMRSPWDLVILNVADRTEARRWHLPEASAYAGTFLGTGTAFCTLQNPNYLDETHQFVCRDIASGLEISKRVVETGSIAAVESVGGRVFFQRHDPMPPLIRFDANYFLTRQSGFLMDLQTGQVVARWRLGGQRVLPKVDAPSTTSVSPDGEMVAIGGSGTLRIYEVSH